MERAFENEIRRLLVQARRLNENKLYDSVRFMYFSYPRERFSHPGNNLLVVELMKEFGDGLKCCSESACAIECYETALRLLQPYPSAREEVDVESKEVRLELTIRESVSELWMESEEEDRVFQTLGEISEQVRSSKAEYLLGEANVRLELHRSALFHYFSSLQKNDLAIQAAFRLVEHDMDLGEILALIRDELVSDMVNSYHERIMGKPPAKSVEISAKYPENPYLVLNVALQEYEFGMMAQCQYHFEMLVSLNEKFIEGMDIYAFLLKTLGRNSDLSKLATIALKHNPGSYITKCIAAILAEMNGDVSKAFTLVDSALIDCPTHPFANFLMGSLLFSVDKMGSAVDYFSKIVKNHRSIIGYQGLVESLCGLRKYNEALAAAKTAGERIPENPRAAALVGSVLGRLPEWRPKAKELLGKLVEEHVCIEAVQVLAEILLLEKKFTMAEDLFAKFCEKHVSEFAFTQLGNVQSLSEKFAEARCNYYIALDIQPNFRPALEGLKKLERITRGNTEFSSHGELSPLDRSDRDGSLDGSSLSNFRFSMSLE